MSNPPNYTKTLRIYKQIESPRYRTLRLLFDLVPEDIAFLICSDGAYSRAEIQRQCREYYATFGSLLTSKRTYPRFPIIHGRQEFSVPEVAFLRRKINAPRNKLRDVRMRTGLSQRDIAYIMGISQKMLAAYEKGTKALDYVAVLSLSLLYGMFPEDLLTPQFSIQVGARLKVLQRWWKWRTSRAGKSHGKQKTRTA
jgi:DNA-binding transcriptional regulator YiaG